MSQQIKKIKDGNVKFIRAKMFQLPSLTAIGFDGQNHINIWESGDTNLGRALSSFTAMPFKHSVYGKFTSIEGFWHYIRSTSKDDNLRHLSGYNARSFGRSIENDNVPDMYYIIADANWQKIKSYPALLEEIRNLHLPFDAYYLEAKRTKDNPEPVRARSLHSTWLVPAFHEIHEAIHQNREPDFTFIKDENKSQFYHPLVKKERFEGGYNAHLLDMYREKQVHAKPRKASFLETVGKDGSHKVSPGNEAEVEIDDLTLDALAAKKVGMASPVYESVESVDNDRSLTSSISILDEAPFQSNSDVVVVETDKATDSIVVSSEQDSQVLSEQRDNHATN